MRRGDGATGRRDELPFRASRRSRRSRSARRELQVHCYRILGSVQDAEDLVQETLLAAWRGLDGFEGRASLRTWLYRIATNRCLNALRDRGRRPPELPPPAEQPPSPPEPTRLREPVWLEPYPDALLDGRVARARGALRGARGDRARVRRRAAAPAAAPARGARAARRARLPRRRGRRDARRHARRRSTSALHRARARARAACARRTEAPLPDSRSRARARRPLRRRVRGAATSTASSRC